MLEKIKEKIRIKRLVNQKCVTYNYIKHFVGPELTIRNGYGYGFVSDEFIYDNGYLELGFGKIRSGYGD